MALHSKESLTIWKRNANNICTTKSCWWICVISRNIFKFITFKQLIFAIMLWCLIMYTTLSLYCRNYKLCLDRKLALPYVCVRYFHRQFSMCLNNLLVVHVLIIPWNFTSSRYSRAPANYLWQEFIRSRS